jgi:putative transposase
MSFALIDAKRAEVPIETACAALNVSVSGFYAWKNRGASPRQHRDLILLAHIRAEFSTSNETYGSPRMHAELQTSGLAIGRHRVARLMSENGLKARQKTRWQRPRVGGESEVALSPA